MTADTNSDISYIVYQAISPSGKFYIGMTKKSLEARHKEHERHSKNDKTKRIFYEALKKYQLNFSWQVLESNLAKKEAEQKEIEYITKLQATNRKYGYNQAKGGLSGDIRTKESKIKWKENMQKYWSNPEYIERVSITKKREVAENSQVKERLLKCVTNYFSTQENRENHSLVKGGRPFVCVETGEVFKNLHIAGETLNVSYQNIWKVLKGKRKHAKGYSFRYV